MSSNAIVALATMIGISVFGTIGCAETPPPATKAKPPSHAVVVDFYKGSKVSAACSGTLISSNVVLTAAHCADGSTSARVTAPGIPGMSSGSQNKRVLAKRIHRYDWRSGGSVEHHAVEHDLALVVLRTPIKLAKYAQLDPNLCTGCTISRIGRVRTKREIRPTLNTSGAMRIGKKHPAARPFELYVPRGSMDAGGALVRTDAKGKGRIVGVMIGTGGHSHGGYAARLDESEIQSWIRGIVYSSRLKPVASSSTIRTLDAEDEETTSSEEPTEVEESPPEQESSEGSSTPEEPAETNPYEPRSEESPTESTDNNPTDINNDEPKPDTDEQSEAPEQEDVAPGGKTDNAGETDNSETTEASATTEDEDHHLNNENENEKKEENETPTKADVDVVDAKESPSKDYDETPTLKSGTDKQGFAYTETDNASIRFKSDNPTDADLKQRVDGYAQNNKNVNVVSTHGSPGWMEAPPSDQKLQELGKNGKPIIMASCFGNEPGPGGTTNAQAVADKAGVPRENVYGCNGVIGPASDAMRCDGTWRDAAGNEISRENRIKHGLQNCTQVPYPGRPGYVQFTCSPN